MASPPAGGGTSAAPWCWEASARAAERILPPLAGGAAAPARGAVPVTAAPAASARGALESLPPAARRWAEACGAKWGGKSGELLLVPGPEGSLERVLLGMDGPTDVWGYAALSKLPQAAGNGDSSSGGGGGGGAAYTIEWHEDAAEGEGGGARAEAAAAADAALLGWMLGHYKFDRYKGPTKNGAAAPAPPAPPAAGAEAARGGAAAAAPPAAAGEPRAGLVCPAAADRPRVEAVARAVYWARHLINTPANDLGPGDLAAEAAAMAACHPGAECRVTEGVALLEEGYPLIHAVGRASSRPPCLIDITWQPPGHPDPSSLPLLALVGKGVCFDTGGLNLKTAAGMKTMKKDMGGAALMLALSHVLMSRAPRVRLRVLVPAVENSVSGDAYRPLDVLTSRAGITIEQGNCDAEGRLILADALAEAAAQSPDLIIDAATLTGAARAALGPELPAVFSRSDGDWRQLEAAAAEQCDPLWRLPLHPGYRRLLDSKVADIGSVTSADSPQGGAIVAALFLSEFVPPACRSWIHIDTGAWVAGGMARPGRPDGGEALGLFALAAMLEARYGRGSGRGGV